MPGITYSRAIASSAYNTVMTNQKGTRWRGAAALVLVGVAVTLLVQWCIGPSRMAAVPSPELVRANFSRNLAH